LSSFKSTIFVKSKVCTEVADIAVELTRIVIIQWRPFTHFPPGGVAVPTVVRKTFVFR
jgi:hypothetical protein